MELRTEPGIEIENEDIKVLLFQSVRELLFNVAKHARVSSADVRVFREDQEHLRIVLRDQGQGFDPDGILKNGEHTKGFGILSQFSH